MMFLLAVSTAAGQKVKPLPVLGDELVTDTIHYTQRVSVTICCGPAGPCDPGQGEVFMLARRLLSARGSIEIDVRLKTLTVTDHRAVVESIRQLVESHAIRTSSTDAADSNGAKARAAVRAVLAVQVAAWNRGDIEGYMDGYDQSRDTWIFSGENFQGWQDTLELYRRTYDTREKMDMLTFLEVEVAMVSKDAGLVFGRWHLQRVNDEPHGRFTLLFKKTKAGWRIVYHNSSSACNSGPPTGTEPRTIVSGLRTRESV